MGGADPEVGAEQPCSGGGGGQEPAVWIDHDDAAMQVVEGPVHGVDYRGVFSSIYGRLVAGDQLGAGQVEHGAVSGARTRGRSG